MAGWWIYDETGGLAVYSNCIVEVVKAKMKNWSSTKIIVHKPVKGGVRLPHALWINDGVIYDFVSNNPEPETRWWRCLWFKGKVRSRLLQSQNQR